MGGPVAQGVSLGGAWKCPMPELPPFDLNSAVDALPKTELASTNGPSKRGRILTQ